MVLTVEDRPSSTRLSRWVWVSISVSSLVCSRVLLSIRAKHLQKCSVVTQALFYVDWCFSKRNRHFSQKRLDFAKVIYLSRNWRTKSSNPAEAKHRSSSIYNWETVTVSHQINRLTLVKYTHLLSWWRLMGYKQNILMSVCTKMHANEHRVVQASFDDIMTNVMTCFHLKHMK